jgi:CHAT domain-containing protein
LTAAQKEKLEEAGRLAAESRRLVGEGKLPRAIQAWKKKVALEKAVWGPGHLAVAKSLEELAQMYSGGEELASAAQVLREALALRTKVQGKKHWEVTDARWRLATVERLTKLDRDERLQVYEARALGKRSFEVYQKRGRADEAIAMVVKSQDIIKKMLGEKHPEYAEVLLIMSILYRSMGDYSKAESFALKSLEITRQVGGPKHPDCANTLHLMGALFQDRGAFARAEPVYQEALQITRQTLGPKSFDYILRLSSLANLYREFNSLAPAEALYREALALTRETLGEKHFLFSSIQHNRAQLYHAMGAYGKAEALFLKTLEAEKRLYGTRHPSYALSLHNLAMLYLDMGAFGKAEPLLQQSVNIIKQTSGEKARDYASGLIHLASIYLKTGAPAKAERQLRRALEVQANALGKKHLLYAETLNTLASFYLATNDYPQSERLYRKALEIQKETVGEKHKEYAATLGNLAVLYTETGAYAKAARLYLRVVAIKKQVLGDRHPRYALTLNNLAALHVALKQWDKAAGAYEQAHRSLHLYLHQVLPAFSEREQLQFLHGNYTPFYHAALSLALERRGDPGMPARSAAWLLNGKALTQETLAEILLLARASRGPEVAGTFKELLTVRKQLANATFAVARPGQEARRLERLAELSRREQDLAKELGEKSGRPVQKANWVELAAVRKALPRGAVLVEIAKFSQFNPGAKGKEARWGLPHYAAWVIPPPGKASVQLIDLGAASNIEAAVQAVRQALQVAPKTGRGPKEADQEKKLRQPLQELSKFLLRPLAPHMDKAGQWILSPDASLWLVPWEALPLPGGAYAVERHQISYLISGRDLINPGQKAATGRPLVFADPDFDLQPTPAGKRPSPHIVPAGLLSQDKLPKFERLPGTAAEARQIAPLLERYTRAKPVVRTGKLALENSFKAARKPRMVVLSTHGFFLKDQDDVPTPLRRNLETRGLKLLEVPNPGSQKRSRYGIENPLLRCGLALAGANRRDQIPDGAEDGILTGLEVVGTDLRGTELVVLSACETGLGQVRNGEGVAGLRQAFQLAGAQAVVATLWQIPDKETTALMKAFFKHLAAKKGKAEALRRAQLEVIKQRRAKGKAAHPFYWAAFTLTGQWR